MLDWTVKRLGGAAVDLGRYASSLFRHLVRALTSGFERDGGAVVQRTTLNQVYFTGVDAVPVVASLLAAGVPLSAVMAFWLSSPIMDPEMFVLMAAQLPFSFTLAKVAAAVAIGLLAGSAG